MQNVKSISILNGQSGDANVRAKFTKYYKSVFQLNTPNSGDCYKEGVMNLLSQDPKSTPPLVDLDTLQNCVHNLKNNKAPGHDGICSENLKFAGNQLLVHIKFVFYSVLCFGIPVYHLVFVLL